MMLGLTWINGESRVDRLPPPHSQCCKCVEAFTSAANCSNLAVIHDVQKVNTILSPSITAVNTRVAM